MIVVAFIQGRDMINYRLMERICKNLWKRPSTPLYKGSGPRVEGVGACNPQAPSSTPPCPRSYVGIIHDETKTSRVLNWEKNKTYKLKRSLF